MIHRTQGAGLLRTRQMADDDVDPSATLTNLADCMLVVVVGLLVALVAHYGIDLNKDVQPVTGTEIVLDANESGEIEDEGFTRAGSVYVDADGSYYMVQD